MTTSRETSSARVQAFTSLSSKRQETSNLCLKTRSLRKISRVSVRPFLGNKARRCLLSVPSSMSKSQLKPSRGDTRVSARMQTLVLERAKVVVWEQASRCSRETDLTRNSMHRPQASARSKYPFCLNNPAVNQHPTSNSTSTSQQVGAANNQESSTT